MWDGVKDTSNGDTTFCATIIIDIFCGLCPFDLGIITPTMISIVHYQYYTKRNL
jgi:hypothetical protein